MHYRGHSPFAVFFAVNVTLPATIEFILIEVGCGVTQRCCPKIASFLFLAINAVIIIGTKLGKVSFLADFGR